MTDHQRIAKLETEVTQLRRLMADLLTVVVANGDLQLSTVQLIAELRRDSK